MRVMVLAGSKWQIPFIKKLKEMGHYVINVNPYEDSPAFPYADEFVLADILDRERCQQIAREKQVDAVMSEQCDIAVPVIAEISEKLGIPTIGVSAAELYTDKWKMREFLMNNGLPCPMYKKCTSYQQATEFLATVEKKMIIKPMDSNSSHGVFTVYPGEDFSERFFEALRFSKCEKAVLCEEYIEGTEFTVDGIQTKEGHVCLAISEKKHFAHNENVANMLYFSHKNEKFDYEKLRKTNDRYVELSGLPYGLTHAEYKYENGEFVLIEIGARGGGCLIASHIVPMVSGVDNYELLIRGTEQGGILYCPEVKDAYKDRCAVLKFFETPRGGGTVTKLRGRELLEDNEKVLAWQFNFSEGDVIVPAKDDSTRVGFYIAYGETEDELRDLMEQIENTVSIELEGWYGDK